MIELKNILLVDDDKISGLLSKKTFEELKHVANIHTLNNGQQALDFIIQAGEQDRPLPELILLDLNMPIVNGFEFLKAFGGLDIKGKDQIKIIVVSSSVNPQDISRAKSLGASAFISKPISARTLLQALK